MRMLHLMKWQCVHGERRRVWLAPHPFNARKLIPLLSKLTRLEPHQANKVTTDDAKLLCLR